jgi:poly(A) polymerase
LRGKIKRGAKLTQIPDYRLNLLHAVEQDPFLQEGAALAAGPGRLYLCGDYVLQALVGRQPCNILLVSSGEAGEVAPRLAGALGLKLLELKGTAGGYHLAGESFGSRSITVLPLAGSEIKDQLADCGFTVTAMALDLSAWSSGEVVDPFGGLQDLIEGRLRAISSKVFADDPVRLLLAAELKFGYGLDPTDETGAYMRASADLAKTLPAARAWPILMRLFGGDDLSAKARFLADTGVLGGLFPEVEAVYEVPQNYYHHRGVWEHTLEVLDILEEMLEKPGAFFRAYAGRISMHMAQEVDPGAHRRSTLGFAALIHDIGKPGVMKCEPSGRIRFQGHQTAGARLTAGIAARMGLGNRCTAQLVGIVGEHMRLGFLLKEGESAQTRLQAVRELGDRCIEVILLSLADRMATRGPASTEQAMELYRRMTSRVLADYFWDKDYPPLVDGRDVMMHTGIGPGPDVGRALFKARVAQREGTVSGRDQALEYLAPDFKGKMRM